jgi:hypothetical protein
MTTHRTTPHSNARIAAITAAILMSTTTFAASPDQVKVGEWAMTKISDTTACRVIGDLFRYDQLQRSGDNGAAVDFMIEHCRSIKPDTEAMIEDASRGALCIRPRGDTECLWINAISVLSKAAAAQWKAEMQETCRRAEVNCDY